MGSKTSKARRPTSYKHQTRNGARGPPTTPTIDSKTSTTNRPIPQVEVKTIIVPRVPQDIVNEILDHLAADLDFASLQSCLLVSRLWVPSCRRHLFHTTHFTSRDMDKWLDTFPVLEDSPARHVRDIRIWVGGSDRVPETFFEYTPWFTNVERISLLGHGGIPPLRKPSLWKFPQSVTSLTINTSVVTLVRIRDIMALLPNLDDLSLSGYLIPVDRKELVGIGTSLRGKFGGRLLLREECADRDAMGMLLEIPTELRFTEAHIRCPGESFPLTVALVEACSKTLVKLTYMATFHGKSRFLS